MSSSVSLAFELTERGPLYAKLDDFGPRAAEELATAMQTYSRSLDQPDSRGMILDLRNNPGGLLDACMDIAGMLLPEGSPVASIKGQSIAVDLLSYGDVSYHLPAKAPLVLLVNSETRSAAEVITAAVQDNKRGVVMGSRTFGKGTVQQLRLVKPPSGPPSTDTQTSQRASAV